MASKELIYYKRLGKVFNEIHTIPGKIISFPIICILVTIAHYCFSVMHFLFETFLYVFNRKQFEENMKNQAKIA